MEQSMGIGTSRGQGRNRAGLAGRRWLIVLVSGIALWLAGAWAIAASGDVLILPTVLFLGSFLAPATLAVWAFDRDGVTLLSHGRVLAAIMFGGGLSFLASAVIETPLAQFGSIPINAGLIEESLKLSAVALLAIGMRRYRIRDGMLLGAAVGLGFAALESSGYAFRDYGAGGHLSRLLSTELTRNLITPMTHGLWTAVSGGFLFAIVGGGLTRALRVPALIAGYLVVAVLHIYWDASFRISHTLAIGLTPSSAAGTLSGPIPALTWDGVWVLMVGLGSAVGLLLLLMMWRRGGQQNEAQPTSTA